MNSPVKQYKQLDVETAVSSASPHELIDMLFRGVRDRLNQARGHMQHGDNEGKCESINACVDILIGLQASLDHEQGGDIAANFDSLYDYMQRRLFRANADNDIEALNEVGDLLETLRSAWASIADQA